MEIAPITGQGEDRQTLLAIIPALLVRPGRKRFSPTTTGQSHWHERHRAPDLFLIRNAIQRYNWVSALDVRTRSFAIFSRRRSGTIQPPKRQAGRVAGRWKRIPTSRNDHSSRVADRPPKTPARREGVEHDACQQGRVRASTCRLVPHHDRGARHDSRRIRRRSRRACRSQRRFRTMARGYRRARPRRRHRDTSTR